MYENMNLYRGKRKENGKWVTGSFHIYETRQVCPFNDELKLEEIKYLIIRNSFADWNMPRTIESTEVDPETVGQYTGLTDKKGVKIFEGDIVECWSEGVKARGTVTHRIDGLWIIYPAWQKRIMWGLCPDNDGNTTVEVIGNIHDNTELLETAAKPIDKNIAQNGLAPATENFELMEG